MTEMHDLSMNYKWLCCVAVGALPWSDCPEPGSVVAKLGFEAQQIVRQIQAAEVNSMSVPIAAMEEWVEEAKKIGWNHERARELMLGQYRFDS